MSCTAKQVLAVAAAEVGYKEKKSNKDLDRKTANAGPGNFTKYARDLNKAGFWNGDKNGYDWCTTFVAWCFWKACGENAEEAKIVQPYGPYGASCKWQTKYYQEAKRWANEPEVGYQAFFTRGHTGLVEKVTANKITLIEGNSNNKVERRTYQWPNAIFTGFGVPRYAPEVSASVPKEDAAKPQQKPENAANSQQKPKEPPAEQKPAEKPVTVFAPYDAKVTPSNGLNVRTGPGTGNKKLGALKCGAVIRVLEEKSGWGRIAYKGKTGWVCLAYTKRRG